MSSLAVIWSAGGLYFATAVADVVEIVRIGHNDIPPSLANTFRGI